MRDATRRAEFETVCLPFMRQLYGTAVRMTGRPEDSSDLVQETYLRAYRGFDRFRPGTNAKAWLYAILHSAIVSRYHKDRRTPESVSLDDVDERFLAAPPGAKLGVPGAVSSQDLEEAVRALPEAFRAALVLIDIEGLTYEEAAAALACPVGTVRSRLSRARQSLFLSLAGSHGRSPQMERG